MDFFVPREIKSEVLRVGLWAPNSKFYERTSDQFVQIENKHCKTKYEKENILNHTLLLFFVEVHEDRK